MKLFFSIFTKFSAFLPNPQISERIQFNFLTTLTLILTEIGWSKPAIVLCRYTEGANNVQKEETIVNIQFVLLDSSTLKFSILSHCNEWQNGFTSVLKEMATNKLAELHSFMEKNSKLMRTPPESLDHLSASIALLEDLQGDLANTEAKIPPLHEQFVILEKYEVEISERVSTI